MLTIDLPEDVRYYVKEQQLRIQKEKGIRQYNQQQTIYCLLHEHKEQREEIRVMEHRIMMLEKEITTLRTTGDS